VGIQKSEAILLGKRDLRETSAIAIFLTKDFGKIKTLIKGVRGQQAKFGLYLREFAKFDIVFYEKQKSDTYMVTQCDLKEPYTDIAENLDRSMQAYYVLELIDKFIPLNQIDKEVYELADWTLSSIGTGDASDKIVTIFELKLLQQAGFLPEVDSCMSCSAGVAREMYFSIRDACLLCHDCSDADLQAIKLSKGAVSSVNMIRKSTLTQLNRLKITATVSNQIRVLIDRFIEYHLGEHLKTKEFIKQVS